MLAASVGLIGISLTELSLYVNILEGGSLHEVALTEGPLRSPTLYHRGATDVGEMAITVDGSLVAATGTFDNMLTADVVESVSGTVEADCGPRS